MNLTNKGVEQHEEVIRLTFAFINKMREQGVMDYMLQELKIMNQIGFSFLSKKGVLMTSQSLAMGLQQWRGPEKGDCEIEDIIRKHNAREIDRTNEI